MPSAPPRRVPPWLVLVLVLGMLVLVWGLARPDTEVTARPPSPARSSPASSPELSHLAPTPDSGLARVAESALPPEAVVTLRLVRSDGPFAHDEDGGVFGNRERLLPDRSRGYYREYTVETPGEGDRGPRRIVAGNDGDLYWTVDHYASFRQVEVGR